MRAGLVKRHITDKNGKRTSVWVRPQEKVAEKRKNAAIRSSVKKAEAEILEATKNEYEACAVVNDQGKVVFRQTGERSRIQFTKEELERMKGMSVFTHNHPKSTSLSFPDLVVCVKNNIGQMRAIAPNSYHGNVTFVFEKGKLTDKDMSWFTQAYMNAEAIIRHNFWDLIDADKLSEEDANAAHHHNVMLKMFKGLYSRELEKAGAKYYFETR